MGVWNGWGYGIAFFRALKFKILEPEIWPKIFHSAEYQAFSFKFRPLKNIFGLWKMAIPYATSPYPTKCWPRKGWRATIIGACNENFDDRILEDEIDMGKCVTLAPAPALCEVFGPIGAGFLNSFCKNFGLLQGSFGPFGPKVGKRVRK